MSGSRASFRAAAETGDPPNEVDLLWRDFERTYGPFVMAEREVVAWQWAQWGLRWARRFPCDRDCCAEQLAMDLRVEGGA